MAWVRVSVVAGSWPWWPVGGLFAAAAPSSGGVMPRGGGGVSFFSSRWEGGPAGGAARCHVRVSAARIPRPRSAAFHSMTSISSVNQLVVRLALNQAIC